MTNRRGFTLIELMVVIAIIGLLASAILVILSGVQKTARDRRRLEDLLQLKNAIELYNTDHQQYPLESAGANGNVSTNATLAAMLKPYLSVMPKDPSGIADPTFYYYYDGKERCGNADYAVIFARQMDRPEDSNYQDFLNTTCGGVLDGEGRGGGTQSYSIRLGESGG